MALELGTAYISILPSTDKLAPAIKKELRAVEKETGRAGASSGRSLGAGLLGGVKKAVGIGGIGAAIVGGAALKGGVSRLLAIEDAEAKLRGLGHTAKGIEKIMGSALDAVRGTSFGMGEAATTAAGAVAAGIKPGKELTKYLTLVADSATIAGSSMDEMGSVLNKVTTAGAAYTEDLNMLADRGIPIFKWLQDEYGVTATELRKMIAKGKVDSATYRKVITENIGGAAQESGNTTRGAFKNMQASLGRIGANFLSAFGFDGIKGALQGVTEFLGPIEGYSTKIGEALSGVVGPAFRTIGDVLTQKVVPAFSGIATTLRERLAPILGDTGAKVSALKGTFSAVADFIGGLIPVVTDFLGKMAEVAVPAMQKIGDKIAKDLLPAFNELLPVLRPIVAFILKAVGSAVVGVFKGVVKVISGAVDIITGIFKVLKGALTGDWSAMWDGIKKIASGVWQAITGALQAWFNFGIFAIFRQGLKRLVTLWKAPWQFIRRLATRVMSGLNKAASKFWSALRPIFAAIGRFLLKVVGAAFRVLWTVVKAVFKGIGATIKFAWNRVVKPVFSAFASFLKRVVFPVFKFLWNKVVKPVFKSVGDGIKGAWNNVIKPVFTSLRSFIVDKLVPAFRRGIGRIKDIWDGLKSAAAAPVRFIVDTVYNKGIRKVINAIPGVKDLKEVSIGFARGGVLPGYTPGRDVHQFYSPTAGRLALSGGEAIMRPEFTRLVGGARGVDMLNAMARKGRLPNMGGYFLGGVLPLPGATSVSQHTSGYSSAWAGDLNAPNDYGKPVKAWKSGFVAAMNYIGNRSYGRWVDINHGGQFSRYAHLSGFGPIKVGMPVSAGATVGYVGSVGNSSGPHLHFEVNGGSVKGGTGTGPGKTPEQIKGEKEDKKKKRTWLSAILNVPKYAKNVWNTISGMGGSGWSGLLKDAGKSTFKSMVGWADDRIPDKIPLKFLPDLNLPNNPIRNLLKKIGVFDNGGILEPGSFAYNASKRPEAVFNHRQFRDFAESAGAAQANQRYAMTIVNWQTGEGYIRAIADDAIDNYDNYNGARRRMGANR